MTDIIDHQALGAARIALQYRESANFRAYLSALLAQCNEIEALLLEVAAITDIDTAEGVNLDVIGQIVGISRYVLNALPVAFFGFAGQTNATIFGEEGLPDAGAKFREEGEPEYPNTVLTDAQFRLFLRARIARNHSKGTIEDLIRALAYVFDTDNILVDDIGGMAFNLAIGKRLTYSEQTLLYVYALIPKPAGVRISQRAYFDPNNCFGFEGFDFALPFGEETQFQTTVTPNQYDGTFKYDGSRDYSGQVVRRTFVGPGPLIGGLFAEETQINI